MQSLIDARLGRRSGQSAELATAAKTDAGLWADLGYASYGADDSRPVSTQRFWRFGMATKARKSA